VGSNAAGGMDVSIVSAVHVCLELEVYASSLSLVQSSTTDCVASLCVVKKVMTTFWAAAPQKRRNMEQHRVVVHCVHNLITYDLLLD
jgi:hypothetical protein